MSVETFFSSIPKQVAATGNHRVQIFALDYFYLRDVWGPLRLEQVQDRMVACRVTPRQFIPLPDFHPGREHIEDDCQPCLTYPDDTWEPWGIAVSTSGITYVTDHANSLIHRFSAEDEWTGRVDMEEPGVPLHYPTHLALDLQGHLYVVQEERNYVLVLDANGALVGRVTGPEELQGLFAPVAVAIDQNGNLCISDRSSQALYWYETGSGMPVCTGQCSSSLTSTSWASALVFSRTGDVLGLDSQCHKVMCIPARALLEPVGVYHSLSLDSRIYRCPWHRIVLDVDVPTGGAIQVDTFTSESPKVTNEILSLEEARWETRAVLNQPITGGCLDCLIQSERGRYLWLRVTLISDGLVTPVVRSMTVHYPRATLLDYLPAVLREDKESAHFLEEFLSITGMIDETISTQIETMARLFDPLAVPSGDTFGATHHTEIDFLAWLGSWLGLTIERHWPEDRRRMLIAKSYRLFDLRGTAEGLRLHVSIYTGVPMEDIQVLEHYQLRRWAMLDGFQLGDDAQLWGKAIVNRLQIGENSRVGAFQLIDTQDPPRDPFHIYAHHFTVFLPWQPRADAQADQTARDTVMSIIEAAKPAHTQGFVRFMTAQFVISEQTLIGLETVLGEPPAPQPLGRAQLGYDTVVEPLTDMIPTVQIGENTRLGLPMRLG